MQLGLSPEQHRKLSQLTEGRVNMAGLHYLDITDTDQRRTLLKAHADLDFTIFDLAVAPPRQVERRRDQGATRPDPDFSDQWWVKAHRVEEAWEIATGKGVTIVDIDAGYYLDEHDIRGNLDLSRARDFSDKDNPSKVTDGRFVTHGTSVVAIMNGVIDGEGTNGMAPDARTLPFQNFNYDYELDDMDKEEATAMAVLEAIRTPDVDVIVLENQTSTGSSETFEGTRDAVRLAIEAGMIVVSAGGNYSQELAAEQHDDTGSIIVGAVTTDGDAADWSNYGKRVSVAAYGEELYTLSGPDGKFGYFGGTSGATPQVAAAVALMLEANPDLSPRQVRDILEQTRETHAGNQKVGGLLNLLEAVRAARDAKADTEQAAARRHFRREVIAILEG